jgi:hypothetical protein
MWYYQNEEFDPSPEDIKPHAGFIYIITEKQTGMKYIGKKLLWRTIKRPPLKGKKRKRLEVVQSDWKTYFGSSENVKLLVETLGGDAFHREILMFGKGKGELSYLEAKEQFDRDVLLRDDYYNGIINCRINRTTVKHLAI